MRAFMDKDFLLETETARHLFHDYAEHMPLVDYHCHISPREIYENRRFNNLTEVWLGGRNPDGSYFGDHYKWRVMRSNGTPEDYITGDKPLSLETAEEAWNFCSDKLQHDPELTVRGIIAKANVAMIGTTDDPIDTLEWHKKIAEDPTITVKVCPSFRPDKAVNIAKPGFAEYIGKLAASVGRESLGSVSEVKAALVERLEFFAQMGCRASDHGLDYVPFRPASEEVAEAAFRKVMAGESISVEEAESYQTAILLCLGKAYHRLGIAMQIHYSCLRNMNTRLYRRLGPDTGFDMIAQNSCGGDLAAFLAALDESGECPKTILYSLNPADNEQLGTLIGCFQSDEVPGKIQHGSAWWFNDTKSGMEAQMKSLANLGLLGNFVGMLTDSRSFLSYARHDYFRRIFCNLVGNWVENGEYPDNDAALKRIVEGVSYKNAARYFNL